MFEGTNEEMFNSLNKLKNLSKETKIYCGREYTKTNSNFCIKYDSKNISLKEKIKTINSNLEKKLPTIPTNLDEELKTNIFLRCDDISVKKALNLKDASDQEIFSKLRGLKDTF